MNRKFLLLMLYLSGLTTACRKAEVDDQKPVIEFGFAGATPLPCDTLLLGDTLSVRVRFEDNTELGSYRIDIHHNFDHHSHSTEAVNCPLELRKPATNPFVFIGVFDIPPGKRTHEGILKIPIPSQNDTGTLQEGDYHFFISLTDKTGWSSNKGFGIKLLHAR